MGKSATAKAEQAARTAMFAFKTSTSVNTNCSICGKSIPLGVLYAHLEDIATEHWQSLTVCEDCLWAFNWACGEIQELKP